MDQERAIEAYKKFRNSIAGRPPFAPAPYGWENTTEEVDPTWMAYHWILRDHTNAVANEINQLGVCIQRLEAWDEVLRQASDEERHELVFEFINPVAFLALNLPAAIRERTIFAATHLCHHANRIHPDWVDNLEADHNIRMKSLEKWSRQWKPGGPLVARLQQLDGEEFRAATKNFRNRFHHRNPPRLEIGVTATLTRIDGPPGRTTLGLGVAAPLQLAELIGPLWGQHAACLAAFAEFQYLVLEHLDAMARTSANWAS